MRVIKSGVEMTPEQLTRVKGGACACGCNFPPWGCTAPLKAVAIVLVIVKLQAHIHGMEQQPPPQLICN